MEIYIKCIDIINWLSKVYAILFVTRVIRQKHRYEIEKYTEDKSKNKSEYQFEKLNFKIIPPEIVPLHIKVIRSLLILISFGLIFLLLYKKLYIIFTVLSIILFAPIVLIIVETIRGNPNLMKSKESSYLIVAVVLIMTSFYSPTSIYNNLKYITTFHFSNPFINDIYKIFIFGLFNSLFIFLILLALYLMIKDLGDWFFIEIAQDIYKKYKERFNGIKKSLGNFFKTIITINTIYIFKEVIIVIYFFFVVSWKVFILPIFGIIKKLFLFDNGYLTAMLLRLSILLGLVTTFLFFKYDNLISPNGMEVFELLLTVLFIPIIYSNITRFREKVTSQIKEDKTEKET